MIAQQKRETYSRDILKKTVGEDKLKELFNGKPLQLTHSGRKLKLNRKGYLKDVKTGQLIDIPMSWKRGKYNRILTIYLMLDESDPHEKVFSVLEADPEILPPESSAKKISRTVEQLNKRDCLQEQAKKLREKLESDKDNAPDVGVPGDSVEEKLSFVEAEIELIEKTLDEVLSKVIY
ncbi:MAG: hypothetical protein KGY45_03595 [Hadesarchaea archaeon]|nr:hypothetical protein [Hadesarchaea archaeon]